MQIIRNNKRAQELWGFLKEDFSKPRELSPDEVHVSELLAPRKAYWVRLLGERVSESMLGLFITGEAFHLVLQHAAGLEFSEQKVRIPGVVGTQDLQPPDDEPTELKTSRKWTVPQDPEPRYIDQLSAYMAMGDKGIGHIVVLYLTANRRWDGKKASTLEIVSWEIHLDAEERREIREQLTSEKDRLLHAVAVKNPKLVDLCPEWQCASIYKGEVENICPFYEECKPEGRYPINVLAPPPKPEPAKRVSRGRQTSAEKTESAGSQKRRARVLR